jgi:glycine/D-amino acid oxidase-like deaminating enzyme
VVARLACHLALGLAQRVNVKATRCIFDMTAATEQPSVQLAERGLVPDITVDVLVIGAGAAGLIAALRAREAGASVLVLERDALPRGSTALSAGLIPAAGTRFQREASISDSEAAFAADIMAKAHDEPDPAQVAQVVAVVGPALEWLADAHGLPFSVIGNFSYPAIRPSGCMACRADPALS